MATIQIERPKPFLPDFCRRQWVSQEARSLWEPRIAAIGRHFTAAERASIETGLRMAALQNIAPEQLCDLASRAAQRGLVVIPLETQGRTVEYAASKVPQGASNAWEYRLVLTMPSKATEFLRAWREKDDETIGRLLGYPACCREFFRRTWAAGSVDPTFEMKDPGNGPIEGNILLRWLGVRYVPHLPCSFRCEETIRVGRQFRALIPEPERVWMDALLSMPMKWTALHGIGEVITPLVTLNFRSDVSRDIREIRREGSYPELGAQGLRFPYRAGKKRADRMLWTDNGFDSAGAMEEAHSVIASILAPGRRTVLDLGCGNGVLARRIAGPHGRAVGVEHDPGRASRAAPVLDETICGNLLGVELPSLRPDDVILFMPGRLIERPQNGFLKKMRETAAACLVYAYGDWLTRYESLEKLCHAAGMEGSLVRPASGHGVSAAIWEWAP